MKKFFILIFFLFLTPFLTYAKDVIRITNGEWPPYLSQSLYQYGTDSWIVKEAFNSVGIEVEYGFFPWNKSFNLVALGKWNASAVWSKTPKREKTMFFSDPVSFHQKYFFHKKSLAFDWKDMSDIKKYRVSVTKKYRYGGEFHNALENGELNVNVAYNDIDSMKSLLNDRVDILPMEINVANYILNRYFSSETRKLITHHPRVLYENNYRVMFSKKIEENKRYLSLFNQGLKIIKESGRFDEIKLENKEFIKSILDIKEVKTQ